MAYGMRPKFGAGNANGIANHYKQVGLQSKTDTASPHAMVLMLLSGAITRIAEAKACMERKDIARKGELLGSSLDIVNALRVSLDKDKGGELAESLEVVYLVSAREILRCNLENDIAGLDAITENLNGIKDAWEMMPVEIQKASLTDIESGVDMAKAA